jgi:hypothetical protein
MGHPGTPHSQLIWKKKMIKKLKDLGFKKVRGTEPGFVMYELTPSKLQAASDKPQAASNKRQVLDKSR